MPRKGGLAGAMDDSTTRKAVALAIMFVILSVLSRLGIMSASGSLTIVAILDSIQDFAQLIGLGIALGLATKFAS